MNNAIITVPVSFGEVIDKITILQIKMKQVDDLEKRNNIRTELDLLESAYLSEVGEISPEVRQLTNELYETNLKLWNIEDDIRECERLKNFTDKFVQLARLVYITNDHRAALKKQINIFLGSALIEEKSYNNYL